MADVPGVVGICASPPVRSIGGVRSLVGGRKAALSFHAGLTTEPIVGMRHMSRRLVSLTLDTLEDLPRPCRQCVYWELDPVSADRACAAGDPGLEKEAWVSQTLLEWGSCGKLAYVDGMPAGFVMYAPPAYVPRSMAFPTSPVSADAALLMTANVVAAFAGGGLGRMLVQGVARDLTKRGSRRSRRSGTPSSVTRTIRWAGVWHRPTSSSPSASRRYVRIPGSPAAPRTAHGAELEVRRRVRAGEAARVDEPGDPAPSGPPRPGHPLHQRLTRSPSHGRQSTTVPAVTTARSSLTSREPVGTSRSIG